MFARVWSRWANFDQSVFASAGSFQPPHVDGFLGEPGNLIILNSHHVGDLTGFGDSGLQHSMEYGQSLAFLAGYGHFIGGEVGQEVPFVGWNVRLGVPAGLSESGDEPRAIAVVGVFLGVIKLNDPECRILALRSAAHVARAARVVDYDHGNLLAP